MRRHGLEDDVRTVTNAWGDVWGVEVDDALWSAAQVVQAVNRSRTWWGWLDDTTPDELARFGGEPREHLMRAVEHVPGHRSSRRA